MEFQKGQIPWNKGLTKEIDERVRKNSENQSKTKKRMFKEGKLDSFFTKGHKINLGKKHLEESKLKMSENARINPNYGMRNKSHSEETKEKMRLKAIGRKISESTKLKLSIINKGKHLLDGTKRKISQNKERAAKIGLALKGKPKSEEHIKHLSESHKGRKFSEEHNKKISESHKGKHHTEKTKEKLSKHFFGKKLSEETKRKISIATSEEKHYNWKGGITPLSIKRVNSVEWIKLSSEIRQRDNNTCQNPMCGKVGGNVKLPVHHIIPFNISHCNEHFNLITLCKRCHGIFEAKVKILGYKTLQERLTKLYGYQYLQNNEVVMGGKL